MKPTKLLFKGLAMLLTFGGAQFLFLLFPVTWVFWVLGFIAPVVGTGLLYYFLPLEGWWPRNIGGTSGDTKVTQRTIITMLGVICNYALLAAMEKACG